jgi:hypothetical protein
MLWGCGKIFNKFKGLGVRFMTFIEFLNFLPMEKPVDRVHGAVDWRRGHWRWWRFIGARALELTSIGRWWTRRMSKMRRCQRGAHRSTSDDEEVRCSEGWISPYIGGGGAPRRQQREVTAGG